MHYSAFRTPTCRFIAYRRIIMDYVRLGASGLQVSRLCLGCMSYGQATTGMRQWSWTLSEQDGRTFIKRALGQNDPRPFDPARGLGPRSRNLQQPLPLLRIS